jgi:hypothetical protein
VLTYRLLDETTVYYQFQVVELWLAFGEAQQGIRRRLYHVTATEHINFALAVSDAERKFKTIRIGTFVTGSISGLAD